MTIWFTSDLHLFHRNIVKFSNRPFADIDHMHAGLIHNWNTRVQATDSVWVLGDFAFRHKHSELEPIFAALNGTKHLVRGNHDDKRVFALPWASQSDYTELKVHGHRIVLSHYAIVEWNRARHGSIHLHGHHHGTLEGRDRCIDVGVDCWQYAPVSWDTLSLKCLPSSLQGDLFSDNRE